MDRLKRGERVRGKKGRKERNKAGCPPPARIRAVQRTTTYASKRQRWGEGYQRNNNARTRLRHIHCRHQACRPFLPVHTK
ncbi:hypothetical protein VTH06DRAFT_465 [Thermothelomyces fergusii]